MEIPLAFVALLATFVAPDVNTLSKERRLSLNIRIVNAAGVPSRELSRAAAVVRDVFHDAGVHGSEVSFHGPGEVLPKPAAGARPITIWIVHVQNAAKANERLLGLAVAARGTAYIFYNRVRRAVDGLPADRAVVLGRVIAHEIGHLLLPAMQHSEIGIMRGDIDLEVNQANRFSKAQAEELHRALNSAPAEAALNRGIR